MTVTGKNRIMILGPKNDGTYVVEFRTVEGEALAISIPRSEAHVIRHFRSDCRTDCSCRRCRANRQSPARHGPLPPDADVPADVPPHWISAAMCHNRP